MNKDFSKLRPFDPKAAKVGDKFLWINDECEFLGIGIHAEKTGENVLRAEHAQGLSYVYPIEAKEIPLAWVRKSRSEDVLWPVYKGDTLYYGNYGATNALIVDSFEEKSFGPVIWQKRDDTEDKGYVEVKRLTFTPHSPKFETPKTKAETTKTRQIKILCYFNGCVMNWVKEEYLVSEDWKRVPAEDKVIEVEE